MHQPPTHPIRRTQRLSTGPAFGALLLIASMVLGVSACTEPLAPKDAACLAFYRLQEAGLRSMLGQEDMDAEAWSELIETMADAADRSGEEDVVNAVEELDQAGRRIAADNEPPATELDAPRLYDAMLRMQRLCR